MNSSTCGCGSRLWEGEIACPGCLDRMVPEGASRLERSGVPVRREELAWFDAPFSHAAIPFLRLAVAVVPVLLIATLLFLACRDLVAPLGAGPGDGSEAPSTFWSLSP